MLIAIGDRLDPGECIGLVSGIELGDGLRHSLPHVFGTSIRHGYPNLAFVTRTPGVAQSEGTGRGAAPPPSD